MNDKKSSESRRKLLKSIAAGSGAIVAGKSLPEEWARPVVDSVMLPVHAQTSTEAPSFVSAGGPLPPRVSLDSESLFADLSDALVPVAKANGFAPEIPCIVNNGDGTVTVDAEILGTTLQKKVTVGAAKVGMDICPVNNGSLGNDFDGFGLIKDAHAAPFADIPEVQIDSIAGNAVGILYIDGSEYDIDLPPGPCTSFECQLISDRNIKENFSAVDEQEILNKVANLNIEHWNYNDREQGVRHIGPMAQDFMAAFNVGDSDRHIHMVDANGVNMAAIKALNTRLEEKDAQIITLQEQLDKVMKRLDELS